jgi:hypothetical protein
MTPTLTFGKTEKVQVVRLPDGSRVEVKKRSMEFRLWHPDLRRWGKPVLDMDRKQVCAETAVAGMLLAAGWEAVWVSSNRYRRDFPPHSCNLSPEAETELLKVRGRGRKLTGCWDVFAFNKGIVQFIECKQKGRDYMTASQRDWIAAALNPTVGFTVGNFLIVEWTAVSD